MEDLGLNLTKSLAMQRKAKDLIPGMTHLLSKRPDRFSYGVWPGYFSKAKGVNVWDLDGNKYIDMSIGGIGANVLGYGDPDVDEAVLRVVRDGTSCSLNCAEEVELAELLCELHPWAQKVRFARTGGEAMAIAIRIARAYTGRDIVAFCGYHGWHDWYLAANLGKEDLLSEHLQAGLIPRGVPKALAGTALPFRYNEIETLKQIVSTNRGKLAAIIMEPIRNIEPEPGFLKNVMNIAKESRSVFILDEISAGFRLSTGGAHLALNVTPDIAVFSKAMANGYPMAAVLGKSEIMAAVQNTFISSTFWTERIGPAAALATIKKHSKCNVDNHLKFIGEQVQTGWKELSKRYGIKIKVSGIPSLSHFSFLTKNPQNLKALFIQQMLMQNFLASNLFYPMYAHTREQTDAYLQGVEIAFSEISNAIAEGNVEARLVGQPAISGFKRLN